MEETTKNFTTDEAEDRLLAPSVHSGTSASGGIDIDPITTNEDEELLLASSVNSVTSVSGGTITNLFKEGTTQVDSLKAFIVTRGPDNLTFAQASRKLFVARRNIERLSAQGNLGAAGSKVLTNSKEICEDRELIGFVRRQKIAREKLKDLGVEVPDESTLQQNLKRDRSGDAPVENSSDKRRKSTMDANRQRSTAKKVDDPKPGTSGLSNSGHKVKGKGAGGLIPTESSKPRSSTSKANPKKREQSPTKAQPSDNSLKLALVDDDRDNGRIDAETSNLMESKILELFVAQSDDQDFITDASWERGRRVYTCYDERSKLFMIQCFESLSFNNRNIRLIPYDERFKAGHPRGWIWVKVPHVKQELLLEMLHKQNKPMAIRGKWSVLRAGKKRDYGQFFLLQIHRETLPLLIERKFKVRIGFGSSVVKLEEAVRLGPDEEPQQIIDNDETAAD